MEEQNPPLNPETSENVVSEQPVPPRNRGGCLTAYLLLVIIANAIISLIYLFMSKTITESMPSVPAWATPVLAGLGIINVASAIATWYFKKIGVYGLVGTAIIALVVNVSIGLTSASTAGGLIGPVILIFLVRPMWEQFD